MECINCTEINKLQSQILHIIQYEMTRSYVSLTNLYFLHNVVQKLYRHWISYQKYSIFSFAKINIPTTYKIRVFHIVQGRIN